MKKIWPQSISRWNSIQRFLQLLFLESLCGLEHIFSENCLDLEFGITLSLVGIPNSSTEGMWISNGLIHSLKCLFLLSEGFESFDDIGCAMTLCCHTFYMIYMFGLVIYDLCNTDPIVCKCWIFSMIMIRI